MATNNLQGAPMVALPTGTIDGGLLAGCSTVDSMRAPPTRIYRYQVAEGGTVTATVTALNANRNAVPSVAVALSSDSGVIAISNPDGSVTNSAGILLASISLGSNLTAPRVITITAKSGSITKTTTLQVVTSTTTSVPASVEVIAGATTVGTGGDTVSIRAFVKDANNNALVQTPVSFTTNTGTLSSVGTTTDNTGTATATFSAGADKSNRTAVITVAAGTISSQLSLPITGTKLTLSGPSSLIVGSSGSFDVVLTDSKSNVVPNVTITATSSLSNSVTATGGAVTNSNGLVRFNYTATNSGSDTLVFSGAGATVTPSPALVISSEDFAFMLQVKPGAYLRLGQGGEGSCFLHNSRYDFNDEVLPLGAALMARLVEQSLPVRTDSPEKTT